MPFGITPALEIFQMKLDQDLENLKGVCKIADDTLITGQGDTEREADEDHNRNLSLSWTDVGSVTLSLTKASLFSSAKWMVLHVNLNRLE